MLLERAGELAAVDAVIAHALAGFGRVGVVVGSAGIGKSAILSEGRARAAVAGMTVLAARGVEIDRSFPYGVVRQLFERLVAQSDPRRRSRLPQGAAAHASRLFSAEQPAGQLGASDDDAFPEMTTVFARPREGRDGHRTPGLHLLAAGFLAGVATALVVSYGGG